MRWGDGAAWVKISGDSETWKGRRWYFGWENLTCWIKAVRMETEKKVQSRIWHRGHGTPGGPSSSCCASETSAYWFNFQRHFALHSRTLCVKLPSKWWTKERHSNLCLWIYAGWTLFLKLYFQTHLFPHRALFWKTEQCRGHSLINTLF